MGNRPSADLLRAELHAMAADLTQTYGDLELLAEELGQDGGDEEDRELAGRVSGWVGRLALILGDMQRRLLAQE